MKENQNSENFNDESINNMDNLNINKTLLEQQKAEKKKGELNFKKWLLTLSSIGNIILGGLLLVMAISAMRYHLDSIFIADKGLLILSVFIIISSILCFVGLGTHNFFFLLLAFYIYILTIVFLSIFSLGAVTMNKNLIDWIDTHWDLIRYYVHNLDMNKFKDHVTTEINSLGIFSLTLIAIIGVSMACITNFLKMKNIIFVLAGPINLIFTSLSLGLIVIGFYVFQNAFYGYIPRWSCVLVIILGFLFSSIGIFGWITVNKMKKNWMIWHLISLAICFIASIFATIGIFNSSGMVMEALDEYWEEISNVLNKEGYTVRKSYMENQLIIQLKMTGFYLIAFMAFSGISFCSTLYIFISYKKLMEENKNKRDYSNDLSGEVPKIMRKKK
jgi:hypothetical protein